MKKGFTLIELLAVIVIIGVIALIAVPITTNVVEKSKEKAYERTVANIEESAYNYSIYNNIGYSGLYKTLSLEKIQEKGYLESKEIIDPRDNSTMQGCVIYRWIKENNQYEFKYDESCNAQKYDPEVVINVINGTTGWMNKNIIFNIEEDYDSYKYCVGNIDCTKDREYIGQTTTTETGKGIYICATGYMDKEEGKSACVGPYNVDPNAPELAINSIKTPSARIIVDASCSDKISGVQDVMYSIDGKEYVTSNIFSDLTAETHNVKVRCRDNAGNISYNGEKGQDVEVKVLNTPTIASTRYIDGYYYAQYEIDSITYKNVNKEYEKNYIEIQGTVEILSGNVENEGNNRYKVLSDSVELKYTTDGTLKSIIEETYNNITKKEYVTWNIVNIDSTKPSITSLTASSNTNSINLKATDDISGIIAYAYSTTNSVPSSWTSVTATTSLNTTISGLEYGTTYYVWVKDQAGNISSSANTTTVSTYFVDVNPVIDGTTYNGGLSGFTFDVYVNGSLVANDAIDWNDYITYGSTVRVIANSVSGYSVNYDVTQTVTSGLNFNPTWTPMYWVNINIYNPNGVEDGQSAYFSVSYDGGNTWYTNQANEADSSISTVLKGTTIIIKDLRAYYDYYEYNTTAGATYSNGQWTYTVTEANHNINIYMKYKTYGVDVNPIINGTTYVYGLSGFTFDVYINGSLVANDVIDWADNISYGSTVRVIANSVSGYSVNYDVTQTVGTSGLVFSPSWVYALPSVPSVNYVSGVNEAKWQNNIKISLSSSSNAGIAYYEIDVNGDGLLEYSTNGTDTNIYPDKSTFIPWSGFVSDVVRFRAVDNAGNRSDWTGYYNVFQDTQNPTHDSWWWGEISTDIVRLYIRATDNASGINRVQCPTSTESGGYSNWIWYTAVWDSSANAYRCDIKPSDYGHYGQTYLTHLYMYDNVENGGFYNQASAYVPAKYPTYAVGTPIYYNPQLVKSCTEAEYNANSDTTNSTGCLKFYVISDDNSYKNRVDLLAAHNINRHDIFTQGFENGYNPIDFIGNRIYTYNDAYNSIAYGFGKYRFRLQNGVYVRCKTFDDSEDTNCDEWMAAEKWMVRQYLDTNDNATYAGPYHQFDLLELLKDYGWKTNIPSGDEHDHAYTADGYFNYYYSSEGLPARLMTREEFNRIMGLPSDTTTWSQTDNSYNWQWNFINPNEGFWLLDGSGSSAYEASAIRTWHISDEDADYNDTYELASLNKDWIGQSIWRENIALRPVISVDKSTIN